MRKIVWALQQLLTVGHQWLIQLGLGLLRLCKYGFPSRLVCV